MEAGFSQEAQQAGQTLTLGGSLICHRSGSGIVGCRVCSWAPPFAVLATCLLDVVLTEQHTAKLWVGSCVM